MLRPPAKYQQEVKLAELERIATATGSAYTHIKNVQSFILDKLPHLEKMTEAQRGVEIKRIISFIENEYGVMFDDIRKMVLITRVESYGEQKYLVEQTVGTTVLWRGMKPVKDIPQTPEFLETRRVLREKSILRRNKVLANRVALIINKGFEKGDSPKEVAKKINIELGLKNRQGKSNFADIVRLKKGRLAHTNGHFYVAYRIARTELMRMASIQSQNVFQQTFKQRQDVRLQMIAVIDSRTRQQSIDMNGQIANARGEFLYPNGVYYKHGSAPARWSINDRETTIPVFFEGGKPVSPHKSLKQFKKL